MKKGKTVNYFTNILNLQCGWTFGSWAGGELIIKFAAPLNWNEHLSESSGAFNTCRYFCCPLHELGGEHLSHPIFGTQKLTQIVCDCCYLLSMFLTTWVFAPNQYYYYAIHPLHGSPFAGRASNWQLSKMKVLTMVLQTRYTPLARSLVLSRENRNVL